MKKELAMEMAVALKEARESQMLAEACEDFISAEYHMKKKWSISQAAREEGVYSEFSSALKELAIY